MKIARVTHDRCNEYSATTWIWVPDGWTREEFTTAVERARVAYQKFVDDWAATNKAEYPGYGPEYKKYPHKTVAEIDAEFASRKAVYDTWSKENDKSKRGFGWYLVAEGMSHVWDYAPEFQVTIDWGHQHGKGLDLTNTKFKDFPGPGYDPKDDDDDE